MTLYFKVFENVCIASFMSKSSKTFMRLFISGADHILSVDIPLHVAPPSLLLRHLSVLIPLQAVELMPDHYTILRLVPTISVQFLSLCSKQFCLNKKGFPTKMVFVI